MMIHHCIGPNPDHGVYRGMSEAVRVASTFLDNPLVAPEEIDVWPKFTAELISESHYHLCSEV